MTTKKNQKANIHSKEAPSPWALAKPRFTPPRSKLSRPFNNSTNNASMLEDLSFDSENEYLVTPNAKNALDQNLSDTSSNASAVSFTSCSDSSKEVRTKTSIDHVVHQSGWLKRSTRKIKQRKRLQEKEDDLVERIRHLEKENREFERIIQDLRNSIDQNKEISNLNSLNSKVETVLNYIKESRQKEGSKEVISLEHHERKVLELKEEQKKDLIDLQDRMLLWMNTQANVSKEREEMIQQVRQEMIQVKKECVEAMEKAKRSVNTNCCSLREFVKEETCDFQEKANSKIKQLEEALEEAKGRIKQYEATETKFKDVKQLLHEAKSISSDKVKIRKTWKGQLDAFDEPSVTTKGKVDKCDASVVSKITIHDTLTANNLFKELCYNKKVSSPKQIEVPSPSHEASDEDDDFMDALS